ncbi:MAG: DUF484 family protein [Alphaproteobacteria bacterium]
MRKPDEAKPAANAAPTAAQVLDYLRRHPDFLKRHPELLSAAIDEPSADGIIDMRQYLVRRLQSEVRELEEQRADVVATRRAHLSSQSRVHTAVLALLSARTFEHLIEVATTDLAVHLEVDTISLCIESVEGAPTRVPVPGISIIEPGGVDALIGRGRDCAMRAHVVGDQALFGAAAGLVRSDALLRLPIAAAAPAGLLALGSRTVGRFQPGQATELLGFLARVLGLSIRSWLDLPA